ncbi:HAD family hydrolase [Marinicrinis lubricantis]|uniref:HAD family hydrolase n=1 Tax=Marinicrinis lubricantis TaxID=2086470 RepID=A0ABW1IHZ0_9BACL
MSSKPLLSHKKMLFFDVVGTLVDPEASFQKSMEETFHDYTARWDPDLKAASLLKLYQDQMQQFMLQQRRKGSALPIYQLRMHCLRVALHKSKLPLDDSAKQHFIQQVWKEQRRWFTLYPEVHSTLQRLSKHYTLGIISNSHRFTLKQLGLDSCIDSKHVYTAKIAGSKKPNKLIFEYALKSAGLNPKQTVMIGDSKKNDVLGAHRAGMDAIWIHRNKKKKRAKPGDREHFVTIHTLDALTKKPFI